jgi:hypothetical protein
VDAPMDESGGLSDVLAHGNLAANELVVRLQDLEPVVAVEGRGLEKPRVRAVRVVHDVPQAGIGCPVTAAKCKAPCTRTRKIA